MATRIGIDTGGTFTDIVRYTPRGVQVHKVASTPADPGQAVLTGLAAARKTPDEPVDVVHGSTVGLNAVLQGRLPRTAFVTNRGFVDLIEIGRQQRDDLYALEPDRPVPPSDRSLRIEVDCRRDATGEPIERLTDTAIQTTVNKVRRAKPQAIAIGLLHSPANPADELRLARALRKALPQVPVTCSAELWPAFGEYERFSATILNAAITPLVGDYTRRLTEQLGPGQLRMLRSSLGILSATEVHSFPARAMFSGPAGGVLATARLCEAAGLPQAAAFDMGGTSTDVCLVQDGEAITDQGSIAGLPLPLPAVDVHTVGCGGGTIAYRDAGGALRVGPQSAGADPGPACYGKGTEPTVTDAHVALGHLGADTLLGGDFSIDPDRSVRAIEQLAKKLGLPARRTAQGILEVANIGMVRALMRITVERTVDPAQVPLVAYGGAGGLHAAQLQQQLGMPLAISPAHPGAFSALGLALAGESVELASALRGPLDPRGEQGLRKEAAKMCASAAQQLEADSGAARGIRTRAEVTLRFVGQGGGLRIPVARGSLRTAFAKEHQRRFGFLPQESVGIEIVQLQARAELRGRAFPRPASDNPPRRRPALPRMPSRKAPLGRQSLSYVPRQDLALGSQIEGPCLIEEKTAVTYVPAGHVATVEPLGLWLRAGI
ncbi:MAG: hydantoinase/oxoprolinase family protein [Planctomycetota bacterium]|nr:hydantoinase/oxoprolinase family protein [Planctomycetota bacterium]